MCVQPPVNWANFIIEIGCIGIGAATVCTLGILGLRRKPFLVRNGIFYSLITSLGSGFFLMLDYSMHSTTWWAAVLISVLGLIAFHKLSQNVTLNNVNYEIIINSFKTVFVKNRLPFEEKLAKFVMPTLNTEIPVVYNAKASLAQVSINKIPDRKTRNTLIQDLASVLRAEHYPGYRILGGLYLTMGLCWVLLMVILIVSSPVLTARGLLC